MRSAALIAALFVATPALAQSSPNPSEAQTQAARSRGPCSDPWVTIALEQAYGGATPRLCNVNLYANGRWGSYDQLFRAVKARNFGAYEMREVRIGGEGPLAGRLALGIFSGGNLVAAGGGNLVAAGGGNLVAAGGGNIFYIVQNTLVSPGGGNYRLQGSIAPVMN